MSGWLRLEDRTLLTATIITLPSSPTIDPVISGTVTTVTASPPNPVYLVGQGVTFTAVISSSGGVSPTGTITFSDGGSVLLGTVVVQSLGNGAVGSRISLPSLVAGSHTITASYSGDMNFLPSTSSGLGLQVYDVTSTTISASNTHPKSGQPITLTAAVSPMTGSGTPTGTITFMDSGTVLGKGTLNGLPGFDQATFTTSALAVGPHTITAVYGGDTAFGPSTSPVLLSGTIVTVAGNGTAGFGGDGGPATSAALNLPSGVAFDAAGDLLIADFGNNRVRKVSPGGVITTVAGDGTTNLPASGVAAAGAPLPGPIGLAFDPAGDLFISSLQPGGGVIYKVDLSGAITTYAGGGGTGQFVLPEFLATNAAGDLFVGDPGQQQIFEVDHVSHAVGAFPSAGPQPNLNSPQGLAFDAAGGLLVANSNGGFLRRVDPATGVISTVASGVPAPAGIAVDAAGDVYVASPTVIYRVDPSGIVTTVAGVSGTFGSGGDGGPSGMAQLHSPQAVAVDALGDVFIADTLNNRVRELPVLSVAAPPTTSTTTTVGTADVFPVTGQGIVFTAVVSAQPPGSGTPTGTVTFMDGGTVLGAATLHNGTAAFTVASLSVGPHGITAVYNDTNDSSFAGSSSPVLSTWTSPRAFISPFAGTTAGSSGDGGLATDAQLMTPASLVADPAGDLFIADTNDNRVREVDTTGVITTVAGTIGLAHPSGVALDASGNLYVSAGNAVYQVNPTTGVVTTYAGGGISTPLVGPAGLAFSPSGVLYVADTGNNTVDRVDPVTHAVTVVAGSAGTPGLAGDAGPPSGALLSSPTDLAFNAAGDLFIADTGNNRIREINHSTGNITSLAIPGLVAPISMKVDTGGDLFIAAGNRVVEVGLPSGNLSPITVAGNGSSQYSGDYGSPATAGFSAIGGIALDGFGNIFISDAGASRVRKIAGFTVTQPTTTTISAPSAAVVNVGLPVTFTATVTPAIGGPPTGLVFFYADGVLLLGQIPLSVSEGVAQATLTTSSLPVGVHAVQAVFYGDPSKYAVSVSDRSQVTIVPFQVNFVKTDATTQGNWKGVYGFSGFDINSDPSANEPSLPSYVQAVTVSGANNFVWELPSADPRALQYAAPRSTDRVAAAWDNASPLDSFSFDIQVNDSVAHRLAVYALGHDNFGGGHSERIDVICDATGVVLDTRTLNSNDFLNGEYLVWNFVGSITIRVTNLNPASFAVISGLFFD